MSMSQADVEYEEYQANLREEEFNDSHDNDDEYTYELIEDTGPPSRGYLPLPLFKSKFTKKYLEEFERDMDELFKPQTLEEIQQRMLKEWAKQKEIENRGLTKEEISIKEAKEIEDMSRDEDIPFFDEK